MPRRIKQNLNKPPLIAALKACENEFRGRPMTSVNDMLTELQNVFPKTGHIYCRVIMNIIQNKPWQLDSNTPEAPLVGFLESAARQNNMTAQLILKKMNLVK